MSFKRHWDEKKDFELSTTDEFVLPSQCKQHRTPVGESLLLQHFNSSVHSISIVKHVNADYTLLAGASINGAYLTKSRHLDLVQRGQQLRFPRGRLIDPSWIDTNLICHGRSSVSHPTKASAERNALSATWILFNESGW
jgi:hypothetical protein